MFDITPWVYNIINCIPNGPFQFELTLDLVTAVEVLLYFLSVNGDPVLLGLPLSEKYIYKLTVKLYELLYENQL